MIIKKVGGTAGIAFSLRTAWREILNFRIFDPFCVLMVKPTVLKQLQVDSPKCSLQLLSKAFFH